jgi:hypothetical protein
MNVLPIDLRPFKGQKVSVFTLSDIQYASGTQSDQCSLKRLEEYLDWTMQEFHDHVKIFIGTGDYIDCMSPSNRALAAQMYEAPNEGLQIVAMHWVRQLADILQPRVASAHYGLIMKGHHWTPYPMRDDDNTSHPINFSNSDEHLAALLGFDYSSTWVNLVKLQLTDDAQVEILASHGSKGGGQLAGSFFNMLEKQGNRYDNVDAVIFSHANRIGAVPSPRLRHDGQRWRDRHTHLIASGSFSRSILENGNESYAERRNYAPLGIGATALTCWVNKDGRKVLESRVIT